MPSSSCARWWWCGAKTHPKKPDRDHIPGDAGGNAEQNSSLDRFPRQSELDEQPKFWDDQRSEGGGRIDYSIATLHPNLNSEYVFSHPFENIERTGLSIPVRPRPRIPPEHDTLRKGENASWKWEVKLEVECMTAETRVKLRYRGS